MSLPARGAWIEITKFAPMIRAVWSLPARGAWIEISITSLTILVMSVAPREGSVD